MNQLFNTFNQYEIPNITLCNPNKTEVASLVLASGIKNSLRYNAISELEFDYPKSSDGGLTIDPAYESLLGKMVVLVDDVGYYIIKEASEDNSGAVPIKHISCQSLEAEMLGRRLTGFSGEYLFLVLLQTVLDLIPTWTIGTVDASLLVLSRYFESNNSTIYNFLVSDMEKAYGCIFEFDSFNKTVSAISNVIPSANTNIILSFDNLVKSVQFKEITDEICTALYCYGGGSLDIHYVNPLGTNCIYDFTYFKTLDWMSQGLITALTDWELSVESQQSIYATQLTTLADLYAVMTTLESDLADLNSSLASMYVVRYSQIEGGQDHSATDAQIAAQLILVSSKLVDISSQQQNIDSIKIELRKIVHSLYFTSQISYANFEVDVESIETTLSEISTSWEETYNSTSDSPGFSPTLLITITPIIKELIKEAMTEIGVLKTSIIAGFSLYPPSENDLELLTGYINDIIITFNNLYADFQSLIPSTDITVSIDEMRTILAAYLDIISYPSNMTESQYLELVSYIYENTYTNENIIITDSLTPAEIQAQSQDLYDQAKGTITKTGVLEKTSVPRYEFTGDFSNFIAVKDFSSFTSELELGKAINIQKDNNVIPIEAVLLEIVIDYDNPENFSMTFSNSFRLDNAEFIYGDLLGTAAQLGSNSGSMSTSTPAETFSTLSTSINGSSTVIQTGVSPVSPSTFGNIVTFSNITGGQMDSGYSPADLLLLKRGDRIVLYSSDGSIISEFASVQDAVNAASTTGGALFIPPISFSILSDIIIPDYVALNFTPGGKFTIPTGVTVTINGTIIAGMQQIFSCSGTGKVVFGNTGIARDIYCVWWGLNADRITDDSVAINASLTAIQQGVGRAILGSGSYYLATGLFVSGRTQLIGAGCSGNSATSLIVPEGITAVTLATYCSISDFYISGTANSNRLNPTSIGIVLGTSANNPIRITNIYFGVGFYYLLFSNLEIDNTIIERVECHSAVGFAAIYFTSAHKTADLWIHHCFFTHHPVANLLVGDGRYGIYLSGCDGPRLTSNIVNHFDQNIHIGCPSTSAEGVWAGSIQGLHCEERRVGIYNGARWADATVYSAGDIVKPTALNANGFVYKAQGTGTSGGTEPIWPATYNATVVDNGVTWEAVAMSVAVYLDYGAREFSLDGVLLDNLIIGIYNNYHNYAILTDWHNYTNTDWSIYQNPGNIWGDSYFTLTNFRLTGGALLENATDTIHIISNNSVVDGTFIPDDGFGTYDSPMSIDGDVDISGTIVGDQTIDGDLDVKYGNVRVINNDVLDVELILNGSFDVNTSNWTAGGFATLASVAGGKVNNCLMVTNGGSVGFALQAFATEIGATYYIQLWYKTGTSLNGDLSIGTASPYSDILFKQFSPVADWTAEVFPFVAVGTTTYIRVGCSGTVVGETSYWDEISIKKMLGGNIAVNGKITAYGGTDGLSVKQSGQLVFPNAPIIGGLTFTIPATGTPAMLGVANAFTAAQSILISGATPALTVGDGLDNVYQVFNGAAGKVRDSRFQTAGLDRWAERADGTTEGGADAGTNYQIVRYHDDGSVFSGNTFAINRANGRVAIGGTPTGAGAHVTLTGIADEQQLTVLGYSTQAVATSLVQITRADTAAGIASMFKLRSKGSGADLDGGMVQMTGLDSSTADMSMGRIEYFWPVGGSTHASRHSQVDISAFYTTTKCVGFSVGAVATEPMISLYGGTLVKRGAALTAQLTTITYTAPGTPDYALQDLVQNTGFGFVTKDEGNSLLSVVKNLQDRCAQLEARLGSATGINAFA